MTNRGGIQRQVARLAHAAPGAFRNDPIFRYATLGAATALLAALVTIGRPGASVPPAPPPPSRLGASYGDRDGLAAPTTLTAPIAPSRSVDGLTITQDPRGQPDRFGALPTAKPRKAPSREETP